MSSPARYESVARPPARSDASITDRWLKQLQPEIARALPKGLDADRMARLALTVVRKVPKLALCTPESFAGALLTASALGLEPGVNGEAFLVPYEDHKKKIVECQLIVGYQGVVKHFWQHPLARGLDVRTVHENDEFDYGYGMTPYLHHRPARRNRGEITEYYAVAKLDKAEPIFLVLPPDEVAELRRGKVGPNGDIPDPQHWMEKKTVLKQLLKPLPKSTSLQAVIDADDTNGAELHRARLADKGVIDVVPEHVSISESEPAARPARQRPGREDRPTEVEDADGKQAQNTAPMSTKAQQQKVGILLNKERLHERRERLDWLESMFGRAFTSSTELTKAEASRVIDYLEDRQRKDAERAAGSAQPEPEDAVADQTDAQLVAEADEAQAPE